MHRRMFCCANESSVLFKRTHFPLWVHLSRSVICSSLMVGHKCVELVAAQKHKRTRVRAQSRLWLLQIESSQGHRAVLVEVHRRKERPQLAATHLPTSTG